MNQMPTYYPGSSIVLMFRVRDKHHHSPIPLKDYEADATIYTRLLGKKLRASSIAAPDTILLERVNDYVFSATLSPRQSEKLPPGKASIKLTLTHQADRSVLIVIQSIFNLKETVKNESHVPTK